MITLTSPILGLPVGATYSGPEEAWALAEGYAKRGSYSGPGVKNTGPATVTPDKDVTNPENRERQDNDWTRDAGPLDPAMILPGDEGYDEDGDGQGVMAPGYDFDTGGLNDEAPSVDGVAPATGPAAGGTKVTLTGSGFKRTSAVTFGGTAGTALKVVSDSKVEVTTPAHAAGAVDVVATNPNGSSTKAGGFTYA